MSFITQKKYMIFKNLSFIQSWNFNLTGFLEPRNFLLWFEIIKIEWQNHKNKNVAEKSLANASPKCSLASLRAKIVIPQSSSFSENYFPQKKRGSKIWVVTLCKMCCKDVLSMVGECILKLVCLRESCRVSEICCKKEKGLENVWQNYLSVL